MCTDPKQADIFVRRQDLLDSIVTVNRDYTTMDRSVRAYRIQGMNGILSVPAEPRTAITLDPHGRPVKEEIRDAKVFFDTYIVTVHIYQAPFFPDRSYRVFNYNPVRKTLKLADGISIDPKFVHWDLRDDRSIEMTPVTK
jgi:hypothetical protein